MGREYKIGDEPIPGYRIAKFIGRGGFGEVWRAVGPGGTEVALKSIALDRKQGMKEFKSLRLVKRIHHPNLVPILAFWLIDAEGNPLDDDNIDLLGSNLIDSTRGPSASSITATMQFNAAKAEQLVIAMGLGEQNLLDLLKDHQAKGLAGIPLEELLDYMEGSARAIDFLNTARHDLGGEQPVAIQHCDIKPQNIMLVGDAVQVCDFGLARSLTDVRSTSVAGSIAYGAPELFWDNKPSHATDQYSLAITYYELRTGHLPFGADMAAIEVMQAHRDGKLDLHHLNDAERAVIKRATAPTPAGRFEKTIDMVRALRRATQGGSPVVAFEGLARPPAAGIRSSIVQTGREIVPGYTLLEHLFHPDARTDVWSASAPGGKPQAIWLYDLTSSSGAVDREALRLMQALTDHPRLARVSGWWLLNKAGQDITNEPAGNATTTLAESEPATMVIASELTRTNLAHHVEDCRQLRGMGIPLDDLLGYMQQIADAVDALNDASHALRGSRWVSLIHTDLRPANLLVFGQTVKIGNFAWCRTLEGEEAEISGMPVRAARATMAPELVAGRIHRRTDQFSLAASYVQMRTGDLLLESGLPTCAASGAVISASLDFSALSEGEAEVIHRAMHADPNERYSSCRKMVAELALAVKKMPAGVLETVYPVSVGPSAGNSTMYPVDLIENERRNTATVPEARSQHDTKPDLRQVIEQEAAPAPRQRWSLRPKITVPLVFLLLAGPVAFFTGFQVEVQVKVLVKERQYKAAVQALEQPGFWRSWRTRPENLRRWIVGEAIGAAKADVKQSNVAEALQIYHEIVGLKELSAQDAAAFVENVLPAAVGAARAMAGAGKYQQARDIYDLLGESFGKTDHRVIGLGAGIMQSWQDRVKQHLKQENFKQAAEIYEQLADVDEDAVSELKADIISRGVDAIGSRCEEKKFIAALDISRDLQSVKAFQGDTGLVEAVQELVPKAMLAVQEDLQSGRPAEAKTIYTQLSQLKRGDSKLRELGKKILAQELQSPKAELAKENWEAALVNYKRIAPGWPHEEWANEEINNLRGDIIQTATQEFEGAIKNSDTNRAEYICGVLKESFNGDSRVEALLTKYDRLIANKGMPEPSAEVVVARLLDQADENITARQFEQAQAELKQAQTTMDEKLAGQKDLHRRLVLNSAFLAVQQTQWDEAQRHLAQLGLDDFDARAESAGRLRYQLLGILTRAHFDGKDLPSDVDLEAISQAIADLRQSQPNWRGGGDRLLTGRVKQLSQELGRRANELAADDDRDKQSRAEKILARLDPADLDEILPSAQAAMAANQTIKILADRQSAWDQIKASIDKWKPDVEKLGPAKLERVVKELALWGRESKEPDALANSIGELGRLPRTTDALRRQYAELLADQLVREASQQTVNWDDLEEKCRRTADAVVRAGASERTPFVTACQAECLVEKALASSSPPPDLARRQVEEIMKGEVDAADRPYVDYVALRISDALHRPLPEKEAADLGDRLCEAMKVPPPILATEFRRLAAASALRNAAKELTQRAEPAAMPFSPPVLPPDIAGRAFRWFDQAAKLGPHEPSLDEKTALATASAARMPVDEPMLGRLVDELSADPQCHDAWILLRGAQAVQQDKPAEAVRRYASAIKATDLGSLVGDSAQTAYAKVIAPALALAQKSAPLSSPDRDLKKGVAALEAAKGRLLRVEYSLLEPGQQPDKEAFAAFDRAVQYDPDNTDYYVQRGFARWSMSAGNLDLATLEREDIDPLFDGTRGDPPPGAYGLRGQAKILEGRQASAGERLDLYRQSIQAFDEAIRGNEQQPGEHYSEFLDGLATANVEMANYTDEDRDAKRNYLNRAIELAEKSKAIAFRPHPDHAWINLGNAEEDFGWVLRDTDGDHYCRAIEAFKQAAADANTALSSPALAMLSQGRCRYKLLAANASCGGTWQDELKAGLNNLDEAIEAGKTDPSKALPDRLRGQACYWQAQLHLLAATKEPTKKKERYQQADAALERAVQIAGKQAAPDYYLSSIALAMNLQDYGKAIDRAKAFIESDSPAATLDSKVIALERLADCQLRRKDVKAALAAYNQYLDGPLFQGPAPARFDLLLDRASLIASNGGRFWSENKKVCEQSATDAVQLGKELKDPSRESKAWRLLAENAKLSFSSGKPSPAERKKYAGYLRSAIQCLPGKESLKDTWGWRVDLGRADYEIANAAAAASSFADAAWFADDAIKTLQGVDAFARLDPQSSQLIASINQVRQAMGKLFQQHKQHMPAQPDKPAS